MQDDSSDGFPDAGPSRRVQPMNAFLCFDVEATCIADKKLSWPNEIIEFPVVLLRWNDDPRVKPSDTLGGGNGGTEKGQTDSARTGTATANAESEPPSFSSLLHHIQSTLLTDAEINSPVSTSTRNLIPTATFHAYVRPTQHSHLSEFCTSLTGITQEMVDAAKGFEGVMGDLEKWLEEEGLVVEWKEGEEKGGEWAAVEGVITDGKKKARGKKLREGVCWVTDGPWDLRDFIAKQVHITPISPYTCGYPPYLLPPYIDLKKGFSNVFSELWYREELERSKSSSRTSARKKRSTSPESLDGEKSSQEKIDSSESQSRNGSDVTKFKSKHKWPPVSTAGGRGACKAEAVAGKTSPGFYKTIAGQLEVVGLGEFVGRQHSGIADATNVARILADLARRDVILEPNGKLPPAANAKTWSWMGDRPGEVIWDGPYE